MELSKDNKGGSNEGVYCWSKLSVTGSVYSPTSISTGTQNLNNIVISDNVAFKNNKICLDNPTTLPLSGDLPDMLVGKFFQHDDKIYKCTSINNDEYWWQGVPYKGQIGGRLLTYNTGGKTYVVSNDSEIDYEDWYFYTAITA